jgi:hypothetical protein
MNRKKSEHCAAHVVFLFDQEEKHPPKTYTMLMANLQKAHQIGKSKPGKGTKKQPSVRYRVSHWKDYDAASAWMKPRT